MYQYTTLSQNLLSIVPVKGEDLPSFASQDRVDHDDAPSLILRLMTLFTLARRSRLPSRYLACRSLSSSISIQDVTVESPPRGSGRPDLVPSLPDTLRLPTPYYSHLRWILQKDMILHQDFCLLSDSAADRRFLIFLYAALTQREVEYLALTPDTSDADLKQRKEVQNHQTVYVDQAPVRAAQHGRLLVLDGVYKAERNVLPTLNNLLENRELSLEDGTLFNTMHPDFAVAALSDPQSTLDPPLRSRFQARLVDGLSPAQRFETLLGRKELLSVPSYTTALRAADLMERQPTLSTQQALAVCGVGLLWAPGWGSATLRTTRLLVDTPTTQAIRNCLETFLEAHRAVVLVGPKGCGKNALVQSLQQPTELFSLVQDLTARDLLVRRGTNEEGDTVWYPTALTRAVQQGTWVLLDGIDKLSPDALTSLARLMEHGAVDLPDGTQVRANEGFRCIALAHPGSSWINPEIADMFLWLETGELPDEDVLMVLSGLNPNVDRDQLEKLVQLRRKLGDAIEAGAVDNEDDKDLLSLSLRKMKHICRRLEYDSMHSLIGEAMLTSLMPKRLQEIVEECAADCGIYEEPRRVESQREDNHAIVNELIRQHRREALDPSLVPDPMFEENEGHMEVMKGILEAHAVHEKALLIMGYQGVGKNKVVDRLLSKLNAEREYVQLHRDSTVQSIVATPVIQDGKLQYEDSPLVRAARFGRILVLDEADKAPLEVVALLKGLVEDGELSLPDGRVLRYEVGSDDSENVIKIHENFRLWALANPAGYPFHGNDLAKEMSDVFSCHYVPPLDRRSQKQILARYAQGVPDDLVEKVIDVWEDLRQGHIQGVFSYPFSIREAVSVVRHLSRFPEDDLEGALENVLSFDRPNSFVFEKVRDIVSGRGISLGESVRTRGEGGISTPRTRAGMPKHGKIDPNDDPHVGGNTWAGGSGGSDTAGLGGRGGPYRLDSGHPVHQISDEEKAQVSAEARERSRVMAEQALQEKLAELKMGKHDYDRFQKLRTRVEAPIHQLRELLKNVKQKRQERVWLKRQTSGELDDSRIVDALAGEKDVFQRRSESSSKDALSKTKIKLVVDISASMYRFNGYDGRLQRLLEATLMLMESLDERFPLEIVGHSGMSASIKLLKPDDKRDEPTELRILESMVAHTQYTWAGDNTLPAIRDASKGVDQSDVVLVISDANLDRYGIEAREIVEASAGAHVHFILIGSLGDEARRLVNAVPYHRAHLCMDTDDLPMLVKNIVASVVK